MSHDFEGYTRELELSGDSMRLMVQQAIDRIVPYVESLPGQPAADISGAVDLARSLMEPLPDKPVDFPKLLDQLFTRIIPTSFNTAGPGYLAYELRAIDGIEIVAEPQLTVVAFRLVREGLDRDQLNALNRDLLNRINARKHVYLTGTTVRGIFVIRICVLSFRTHFDRVHAALADIRGETREGTGA